MICPLRNIKFWAFRRYLPFYHKEVQRHKSEFLRSRVVERLQLRITKSSASQLLQIFHQQHPSISLLPMPLPQHQLWNDSRAKVPTHKQNEACWFWVRWKETHSRDCELRSGGEFRYGWKDNEGENDETVGKSYLWANLDF